MIRRAAALGAVLLGALTTSAAAQTIRDSADIRIVQNPSRLKAPIAFTIAAKPSVEIRATRDSNPGESEYHLRAFGPLASARRLPDGRVAVMNSWGASGDQAGGNELLFFDGSGKLQSTTTFKSPFANPFRICQVRGDTLLVADYSSVGILDGTGHLIRNFPLAASLNVGCTSSGTFLMQVQEKPITNRNDPHWLTPHFALAGMDGRQLADIGWFQTITNGLTTAFSR